MHHRTPDVLKIDVGSVTTREELHSLIAEAFGFPDYYGRNWDAFDECIRDG
jgi:RNAse (barnase) inhibitor barstar